ncbi:hypothetical protein ACTNDN_10380 [Niallia sp. HCP3S3_B10]|uniref:Uncharacterized protein n=1 Tax=Niallia hominis TaxID=3133173 RepID=A0ABV1F7G8_9BACI|nr:MULTISPECIES: hypothetical protein [Bacillaceae]MCM3361433.1 hypothetical protein [Niallia sp. MER TA 168]CAI9395851.1 hypothetical protein BACSP_01058 [Bacillus sp. T2.9-1]
MNHYTIQFLCGQINYVRAFFENYQDAKVQTDVEILNKIKANIQVESALNVTEVQSYLEKIFQQSKYGCALHFQTIVIEGGE